MIQIKNVSKQYAKTSTFALKDVSMEIDTGEAFGLLGPNGAGKTTLMSIITTLALPTGGHIYVDGEEINRSRVDIKRKFSFVTQHVSIRKDMTVSEVMELSGRLYGLPRNIIKEKSERLLEFTELSDKRKNTARGLSGGQQRKLMIARALLSDPEVLILDEPTVGLDPYSRRRIWDMLINLKLKGMTLILTTHYIDEAENVCDRVAFINGGRVADIDTPDHLISGLGKYAADIYENKKRKSFFFKSTFDAHSFAEKTEGMVKLRDTTLEDVFLSKMGTGLGENDE